MTQEERKVRVGSPTGRWASKVPHKGSPLPPPDELARVQTKLVAAASCGKSEFNRVWTEIFHGKYPSPGVKKFRPDYRTLRKTTA
jgi:hypothetical protein